MSETVSRIHHKRTQEKPDRRKLPKGFRYGTEIIRKSGDSRAE